MLSGRHVVMGVTGGIAAYKACEVVSRLKKLGAEVDVIMTHNATKLVAPLTFETLSARPVCVDTFARTESWDVRHISLAQKADVMLVAPATANLMAKLACGIADDMLTTTLLASTYQQHDNIARAAERYARQYGVEFLYRDFRPNFRAGNQKARELGFYMQKYCGCVFSEADRYQKQILRDRERFARQEEAASQTP